MGGIPEFPEYARVSTDIKSEIFEFTSGYPPYSDFNFNNILSWDITGSAKVTMLNSNLVLCTSDYVNSSPFFTFLGDNQAFSTVDAVLNEAELHTDVRALRSVPEIGAKALQHVEIYRVDEDVDSHDYVLSLPEIASKQGSKFRNMRHEINIFESRYGHEAKFKEISLSDPTTQASIVDVFYRRELQKTDNDHSNELLALGRMFEGTKSDGIASYGIEISGFLEAFIICEEINRDWCLGHFWKADIGYRGIYRYLMNKVAETLTDRGYTYMNIQQDLGIEGLKQLKKLFCPATQLKKYTITDNV